MFEMEVHHFRFVIKVKWTHCFEDSFQHMILRSEQLNQIIEFIIVMSKTIITKY